MAVLRAAERNRLRPEEFGLPSERKYPMEDKSHARNAKSRASEMEHKGRLSKSQEEQIDRKADRIIGKSKPKKSRSKSPTVHGYDFRRRS